MLGVSASLEGDIDLDAVEVEVDCPVCNFANPIWLKQARLRDVIICRGCKSNIQLDDSMNSVRKAMKDLRRQMREFERTVKRMFR